MQQPGRRAARVVVGGTLVVLLALVVAGRMLSGGLQPPAARPTPGNHGADRQLAPATAPVVAVVATIQVGAEPTQIAVGAGGVWVGVWATGSLVCIDPASNRVVARIPVGRPQETRSRSRRMPVPCGWWTSAMPGCCASTRLPTGWSPGSRSRV